MIISSEKADQIRSHLYSKIGEDVKCWQGVNDLYWSNVDAISELHDAQEDKIHIMGELEQQKQVTVTAIDTIKLLTEILESYHRRETKN